MAHMKEKYPDFPLSAVMQVDMMAGYLIFSIFNVSFLILWVFKIEFRNKCDITYIRGLGGGGVTKYKCMLYI